MQFADLTGIGAWKSGGRWNPIGQKAVYTSLEIGTAAQESFSHLPRSDNLSGYALMTIKIDGSNFTEVSHVSSQAKVDFLTNPAGKLSVLRYESSDEATTSEAQQIRLDGRLHDQLIALMVPSAINPVYNVVLFPDRPLFKQVVKLESVVPHEFHPALDRS